MILVFQKFGQYFLDGQLALIYDHFSEDFQQRLEYEQLEEIARFYNQHVRAYRRTWSTKEGTSYHDIWQDEREQISISIVYDQLGRLHNLLIQPNKVYSDKVHVWTRKSYLLPIDNEWTVYNGGPNAFLNSHYRTPQFRFAYDFVRVEQQKMHENDGTSNEHYFAFNAKVVAPAHGKVIEVISHIADHPPHVIDGEYPFGNYCIIDHGHNEFSFVAHLKQSSLVVKKGEFVKPQQVIGLCGNSGNTMIPMLHFHIMNKPQLGTGQSFRINFANGIEPIKGQVIHPIIKK